jgi:multicomponent Na+:H+ antiporter subunit B
VDTEQQSVLVKTLCRLLVPFVQLFGLYVIVHGHSSPGGGFQGGVILAASFILLSIPYGIESMRRRFSLTLIGVFTSVGVLLYGGIGVICMLLGANFLDYGALPGAEPRGLGMLGIEIGVGITVMAAMMSIYHELISFE